MCVRIQFLLFPSASGVFQSFFLQFPSGTSSNITICHSVWEMGPQQELLWVFWWSNNKLIQISEIVVSNMLWFAPQSYLFHISMVNVVENNMEKNKLPSTYSMVHGCVSVDHVAPIYLVSRIKQLNQISLTLCTQRSKLWPVSRDREKTVGRQWIVQINVAMQQQRQRRKRLLAIKTSAL